MNKIPPKGKIRVLQDGPYLVTGGVPLAEELVKTGQAGASPSYTTGFARSQGKEALYDDLY